MKLQVLGPGCAKCKALAFNVIAAADALGVPAEIEKVEDIASIMKFGVMSTPALVIDGRVAFSGRVATVPEIQKMLSEAP